MHVILFVSKQHHSENGRIFSAPVLYFCRTIVGDYGFKDLNPAWGVIIIAFAGWKIMRK